MPNFWALFNLPILLFLERNWVGQKIYVHSHEETNKLGTNMYSMIVHTFVGV